MTTITQALKKLAYANEEYEAWDKYPCRKIVHAKKVRATKKNLAESRLTVLVIMTSIEKKLTSLWIAHNNNNSKSPTGFYYNRIMLELTYNRGKKKGHELPYTKQVLDLLQ